MTRTLPASIFLGLSVAISPAHADDPPAPNQNNTTTQGPLSAPKGINRFSKPEEMTEESRKQFNALIAEGDRARLTGRPVDAINAYRGALDIYYDPLIAGRFGIVILMLEDRRYDYVAASHLNEAIDHAAGVNQAERDLFWQTYSRLRRRVCEVQVSANDIKAIVYTGRLRRPATGINGFVSYVNAGANHFRATLAGHPDMEKTFTCVGGEKIWVDFVFEKQKEPPPELPLDTTERIIVREQATTTPPPALSLPRPSAGLLAGIGPLVLFGAAPSPAFGGRFDLWYRKGNVAGMVSARGAWMVGAIVDIPITVSAFSLLAGPCARWQWFDACALGSINAFVHNVPRTSLYEPTSVDNFTLGAGVALGAEYRLSRKVSTRLSFDVVALDRERSFLVGNSQNAVSLWEGGRFLSILSATIVLEP